MKPTKPIIDLTEAREVLAKATPGEARLEKTIDGDVIVGERCVGLDMFIGDELFTAMADDDGLDPQTVADHDAIAYAHNNMPALLDALEEAHKRLSNVPGYDASPIMWAAWLTGRDAWLEKVKL